tara:strand:+ start:1694 stop:2143 length:450 start_codon:yes stop_codon:yes gene_type:complete
MLRKIRHALVLFVLSPLAFASDGLISVESHYSVKETADRFESLIKKKGLTLFTRIDHQKNAAGVDLPLNASEVIIFGNPKIGTPLMQCSELIAIDLPQKVLIREDNDKKVWLSYNDPEYLKERHQVKGCEPILEKIAGALKGLSKAAAE